MRDPVCPERSHPSPCPSPAREREPAPPTGKVVAHGGEGLRADDGSGSQHPGNSRRPVESRRPVRLAGRLHALDTRNADAAHLLALCNLRLGRYKAAFEHSKTKAAQAQHLGCVYVFAQACLGLERFELGATALEKARGLWHGRNHWSKRAVEM